MRLFKIIWRAKRQSACMVDYSYYTSKNVQLKISLKKRFQLIRLKVLIFLSLLHRYMK